VKGNVAENRAKKRLQECETMDVREEKKERTRREKGRKG
jgi:hypothetical protein